MEEKKSKKKELFEKQVLDKEETMQMVHDHLSALHDEVKNEMDENKVFFGSAFVDDPLDQILYDNDVDEEIAQAIWDKERMFYLELYKDILGEILENEENKKLGDNDKVFASKEQSAVAEYFDRKAKYYERKVYVGKFDPDDPRYKDLIESLDPDSDFNKPKREA